MTTQKVSLQAEYRRAVISKGDKESTFETYWPSVQDFIGYTRDRRGTPVTRDDVISEDVYRWRDHLADDCHLSPKTVNQRTAAVKLLFERVIGRTIDEPEGNPLRMRVPTRQRRRMIHQADVLAFFDQLSPRDRLIAELMYAGMARLDDIMKTRVQDYNFAAEQIELCECKHDHFRVIPFPMSLHDAVRHQLRSVDVVHRMDADINPNGVPIPGAYSGKSPFSPRDLRWYWMFPSDKISRDPKDGHLKRYHLDKNNIARKFNQASRRAKLRRNIEPHDLRRAAATHYYQATNNLVKLQEMLGHNSLEQTKDYIFQDDVAISGSDSPFDHLQRHRKQ